MKTAYHLRMGQIPLLARTHNCCVEGSLLAGTHNSGVEITTALKFEKLEGSRFEWRIFFRRRTGRIFFHVKYLQRTKE